MKKQMQTVSCPKSMVGRVIGKNGETIRALQNYSGALIQIDQSTDPMKVTISGTQESVRLAISMVTDIVNGTFKGFAMLRQVTNEQVKADTTLCQPVYAPGYGLIPPSQQLYSSNAVADVQGTVGLTQPASNFSAVQFPSLLPSYLESQAKAHALPPSSFLMGMNNAFGKLSLGTDGFVAPTSAMPSAAASGCANVSPISSLDMLHSGTASFLPASLIPHGTALLGGLSQTLPESTISPMNSAIGDLGLSLSEGIPGALLSRDSPLNLPSTFPVGLSNAGGMSSPLSGSISPELPGGWAKGLNGSAALATASVGTGFPNEAPVTTLSATESSLAPNFHQLTQFLKASSTGSSYSDTSDTAENTNSSRLSPRSNTGTNSTLLLLDPNGRPFKLDVSTGETQWINDYSGNQGLLHPFAAATMN